MAYIPRFWQPPTTIGSHRGRRFRNVRLVATMGIIVIAVCGCVQQGTFDVTENEDKSPVAEPTQLTAAPSDSPQAERASATESKPDDLELATLGAGCYWCVEAVFQQLRGVHSVESGFTGGQVRNPSYEQVCSGLTGHAEVCQVRYDPKIVSFTEVLEVFWKTHDPTTLNRQGHDVGTQYRSAIFYHNEEQRKTAEELKEKLDQSGAFSAPIVTEIAKFDVFYKAKEDHQNFYRNNPNYGYCRAVVQPKVDKFRKVFADKLKTDAR
ncbi:MAG: peptide-methionine (S)-S-oxide reductase MsrA [Planctomycetales bacterium]|nr:peptide-methionine (S)-S-oxide reductase MsrA [Planctomycetales bacterium]